LGERSPGESNSRTAVLGATGLRAAGQESQLGDVEEGRSDHERGSGEDKTRKASGRKVFGGKNLPQKSS